MSDDAKKLADEMRDRGRYCNDFGKAVLREAKHAREYELCAQAWLRQVEWWYGMADRVEALGGETCGCSDQNNKGKVLVTGNLSRASDVVGALRSDMALGGEQAGNRDCSTGGGIHGQLPSPATPHRLADGWICRTCGKWDLRDGPPRAHPQHTPHRGVDVGTCPGKFEPFWLGGEQAEGPSDELGASVSARPCKLRPCPFCGEPKDIQIHNTGTICPYKVRCHYCWAWGPKGPTKKEAVKFWNTRDKGELWNKGDR